MGLLPEIAHGIHRSIPTTGHIISAYALGVVVGAPVIVSLGARLPRRGLAIALVLALGAGNAVTALAHGYDQVMAARFLAGLPHGAYFGVASLIAASMVPVERDARALGRDGGRRTGEHLVGPGPRLAQRLLAGARDHGADRAGHRRVRAVLAG